MLKLLFAVILTESLTELVIKSVIFEPIREKIKSFSSWLEKLFSCGYCFSVWAAGVIVFILQLVYNLTGYYWIDLWLMSFIVHRLSNILHNVIDKYTDKYYDLRFINSDHSRSEGGE